MSNIINDNLILKFAELLAFCSEPAVFYHRNAEESVPHLGALLSYPVIGLAGPGTNAMWQCPLFIATSNANSYAERSVLYVKKKGEITWIFGLVFGIM